MTKQADFKARVRARMARTGESYATARAHLLASRPLPALHVTNGDTTVPGIEGTGLAERIMPWRDGCTRARCPTCPTPSCARIRAAFLGGEARRPCSRSATARSRSTATASTSCGSRPTSTTSSSSSRSSPGCTRSTCRRSGSR